jgi:hypothetical protein
MSHLNCLVDSALFERIRPCMIDDVKLELIKHQFPDDQSDNPDGFPYCSVSRQAIVYSCGIIARRGDSTVHSHPSNELSICKDFSTGATSTMNKVVADWGSEGTPDDGTDCFLPFFRLANRGDPTFETIDEEVIRMAFGGTLSTMLDFHIEPLAMNTEWWESLSASLHGLKHDYRQNVLPRWSSLIDYFFNQSWLRNPVLIRVRQGYGGCSSVFPIFALGMSDSGSLAGIVGHGVHT